MTMKNVNFDIDETIYDDCKTYLDTHEFRDEHGKLEFETLEDFLIWRLGVLAKQ